MESFTQKCLTLLFLVFLISGDLFSFDKIQMNNLSLSYSDDKGEFTSDFLGYKEKSFTYRYSDVLVSVDHLIENKSLLFHLNQMDVEVENTILVDLGLKELALEHFNLTVYPDNFRFSFDQAETKFVSENNNANEINLFHAKGAFVQCKQGRSGGKLDLKNFLKTCMKNGKFGLEEFFFANENSPGLTKLFHQNLKELVHKNNQDETKLKTFSKESLLKKIRNLKLFFKNNYLKGSLQAKFLFNWTLKTELEVFEIEPNKKYRIQLHKAKIGFVSLRKKLLNLLKKQKLKNIEINGYNIYLTI